MEVSYLLSFKNNPNLKDLDESVFENFKDILHNSNHKQKKYKKIKLKTSNNILKNKNLQNAKNKIENKINLILNKISNDNINILIKELLLLIGEISLEDYNLIQKTIFLKMLKELNFVDSYLDFFINISKIYFKKLNYTPDYMYRIFEEKVFYDYLNKEPSKNFLFVKKLNNENDRTNNLLLLDKIIKKEILNEKLGKFINSILLNQNIHIPDINVWFKNKTLSVSEQKKIQDKVDNLDLSFRNKVLLKNLYDNKEKELDELTELNLNDNLDESDTEDFDNEKVSFLLEDPFNLECKNIWDEYLYLGLPDEVKEFILSECKEAHNKNIFCQIGLDIYFRLNNNENYDKIFGLFKFLINNKILYKSNLSRGLLLLYDNNVWDRISKNYENKENKLKIFLIFLKKNGITRGIEFLLKKYNMYYYKKNFKN